MARVGHRNGLRSVACAGLLLSCGIVLGQAVLPARLQAQAPAAPAQAPAPGPAAAPGQAAPLPARRTGAQFVRLSFAEFSQYSYTNHPFFQITGDSDFHDGDAVSAISSVGTPTTASDENLLLKGIHTLPPFGVETGIGMDLVFLKAIGIGFDYTRLSQTDKEALDTSQPVVTIPRIQMDTYIYSVFVKGYAFDTGEPGMNFYAGFGLGILEGKFDAIPFAGAAKQRVGFQQIPIGSTLLGAEAFGENYGLRYEVRLVRARKVQLDKNPYLGQDQVTEIDFSGTQIKISLFYQF